MNQQPHQTVAVDVGRYLKGEPYVLTLNGRKRIGGALAAGNR